MPEVLLSRGLVAIVDEEDLPLVSAWKWSALKGPQTFYAVRSVIDSSGKKKMIYMHRLIMNAKSGQQVDHADRNGLNNSRSNLRFASGSQQVANVGKYRGRSRFKGVVLHRSGRWQAQLNVGGSSKKYLGLHATEVEAARAYDVAAREHFGEYACTNEDLGLYDT